MRRKEKYKGVPSAYTHTASVKKIEPAKAKYAVHALEYPSAPPQRKTIIRGINNALKSTGNIPPMPSFNGSLFKTLPTMYVMSAASKVTSEPIITS